MSLEEGAETVVDQCLDIGDDETVLLVNDGNDTEIIEALREKIEERANLVYMEYPQPETKGTEPPEEVAEKMKESDVFIAPTVKSISHTEARIKACRAGSRGATLPGITKQIWNSSLQADYNRVKSITAEVYSFLRDGQEIKVETPSGTDLEFEVRIDSFFQDNGIMHEPGDMGNLPAGEVHGGVVNASGELVIDHFSQAPRGTKVVVENSRARKVETPEGESCDLTDAIQKNVCVKNIAEFGFGTNPEATLIGTNLQDEKVLGTVHIAFGDNTHYFPESHGRRTGCSIHWDSVCESPTVYFGEKKILEQGNPVFLD